MPKGTMAALSDYIFIDICTFLLHQILILLLHGSIWLVSRAQHPSTPLHALKK